MHNLIVYQISLLDQLENGFLEVREGDQVRLGEIGLVFCSHLIVYQNSFTFGLPKNGQFGALILALGPRPNFIEQFPLQNPILKPSIVRKILPMQVFCLFEQNVG